MGPGRAADIIREGLFRGADGGVLLTDRKFAGADTLATSYALAQAVRKIAPDMIIAGRQAIDGDTAQVGPQVAEKLGWPQITYAEEVLYIDDNRVTVRRRLERGIEVRRDRRGREELRFLRLAHQGEEDREHHPPGQGVPDPLGLGRRHRGSRKGADIQSYNRLIC